VLFEPALPATDVPSLVGIARLAAESAVLSAKRQVEYRSLESRSILNRCSNSRMPFSWTINPYRGCEIGCRYCYARYTHEFMGLDDGRLFETQIYAKSEAADLLRRELRRPCAGAIAIGTSTDPYQPAEKKFGVTRALLEVFAQGAGRELSITTKGDGVTRDLDVLRAISERNRLSVNITVTTVDADLARLLEPRAPRPDLRLAALSALADAGIQTGVFASPILPWITDAAEQLEDLCRAARDAGARYLSGGTLFLKESARQQFFPLLRDRFPQLVADYEQLYRCNAYPKGRRVERIDRTLHEARERLGLRAAAVFERPLTNSQLSLFD
jgi:DNA repair photolyase